MLGRAPLIRPAWKHMDLEFPLLSQSKRLWELIDRSILSGRRKGLTSFGDLPD